MLPPAKTDEERYFEDSKFDDDQHYYCYERDMMADGNMMVTDFKIWGTLSGGD